MNCRDESPGLSEDLPGCTITDVDSTVVREIETSREGTGSEFSCHSICVESRPGLEYYLRQRQCSP